MKKLIVILLCIIFTIAIVVEIRFFMLKKQYISNSNEIKSNTNTSIDEISNNIVDEENITRYIDKIIMEIKDGTLSSTGATVIITDNNEKPYNYNSWYRIDKNINGQWKELEPIDKDYILDELALYQNFEFEIDWFDLYGTLEKGKYRLLKSVFDNSEDKYFWVEFSIN